MFEKRNFVPPKWDTCDLNKALNKIAGLCREGFTARAVIC